MIFLKCHIAFHKVHKTRFQCSRLRLLLQSNDLAQGQCFKKPCPTLPLPCLEKLLSQLPVNPFALQ